MNSRMAMVIYSIKSKNSIFKKMRVSSLRFGSRIVDNLDKLMSFSCNIDPSLSWSAKGSLSKNKWIPVTPQAASGFLISEYDSPLNSTWSVDLELEDDCGSEKSNISFTLQPDYQEDQGLLCLPVSSVNGTLDEIYLYYLFIYGYTPPDSDCGAPLTLNLPSVTQNAVHQPMIVGHAGAGVRRAHYGKGQQWPENTICAFQRAEQLGVKMVECDATLTKDFEVVLHHNYTLGVVEQVRKCESDPSTFKLEHKPDGAVNENSTDLIVNYSLSEIRELLSKIDRPANLDTAKENKYLQPLTGNDPTPNIHGVEAAPVPLLKDAFRQTSPNLAFNVEIKYPPETPLSIIIEECNKNKSINSSLPTPYTYFSKINRFCDKILDTIWLNAGRRYVILSSFNPDICLALRLKQSFLPVLFISRGGIPCDNSHRTDPRHHNIFSVMNWAVIMNFSGIVTVGKHFDSTNCVDKMPPKSLTDFLNSKQLSCFVYGDGVSEMEFFRKASQFGLTGVIVDRLDEFMLEYNKHYSGTSN
ncbi:unnamed protein product [Trichobilharzia szidati]|nr:unnamed protein product [Trichobilharzia szidati]